jgi:hypothetical protein
MLTPIIAAPFMHCEYVRSQSPAMSAFPEPFRKATASLFSRGLAAIAAHAAPAVASATRLLAKCLTRGVLERQQVIEDSENA